MHIEDIEPLKKVETIGEKDKEVIFIGTLYFYGKHLRRNIHNENFEPDVLDWSEHDPLSILKAGFDMHRQLNDDFEGDSVGVISTKLAEHTLREELYPNLDDSEVFRVCRVLDEIFELQEFCAMSEARSYYEPEEAPLEFAIHTAATMMDLRSRSLGIGWFGRIFAHKNRTAIITAIIKSKLTGDIKDFLSSGDLE